MAKSGKPTPNTPKPPAPAGKTPVTTPRQPLNLLERPTTDTPADALQRKIFWGIAAFIFVLLVALSFRSGINADDKFQVDYSQKLVNYYGTFGRDTAALKVPDGNMHLYGGFFEVVTGFANKAFGLQPTEVGYHNVRHATSAMLGWVAILFAALLARLIAGWRAGIITLIIMGLSPRFIGDSLMNPKDIPFAAGYMMAIYNMAAMLARMPTPSRWNVIGLVAGLGISLAVRAGGLLNFAYLGLFTGLFMLLKYGVKGAFNPKTLGKYALYVLGAAIGGYILAVLFWPFALQNPLKNPFVALNKFAELEVQIRVLYEGDNVMSNRTPWHYPLKWMLNTIPLAALIGFLGSIFLLPRLLRKYQPLWIALVYFAAVFPVAYIIYKHSVIHDGWRHLTFAYPPLCILAALFWNELATFFSAKKAVQYAVFGAMGLLVVDSAWFIVTNSAYPYVYFNPINGGIKGAYGQYETDYWGITTRQGIEWMEQQGILKPDMTETVVIATNMFYSVKQLTAKYGDKVKVKYFRWENRYDDAWDYALYPTRFIDGLTLQKGVWPPSNTVHVVSAAGVPLLAVMKDTGKNCALGMASMKLKNWGDAVEKFKAEIINVPDNEIAWGNLSAAYMSMDSLEACKDAAEHAIKINPTDNAGNNYLAFYYLKKGDVPNAKAQFERAVKMDASNASAYYYLGSIAIEQQNDQAGINYLTKCIGIAPKFKPAYELLAQIYDNRGDSGKAQQIRGLMQQIK